MVGPGTLRCFVQIVLLLTALQSGVLVWTWFGRVSTCAEGHLFLILTKAP